jgi:hypothetical protein
MPNDRSEQPKALRVASEVTIQETIMPARPKHIPHSIERTALQKMGVGVGLSSDKLYPAGKQTIAAMLAKGWIERHGGSYFITEAGKAALRAVIPTKD